jgi:Lrp/AsnC family leucine-responsive transcriptional regulator
LSNILAHSGKFAASKHSPMALDRIDIAILDTLQKDGRISNARWPKGRPVAVGLFAAARQSGEGGAIRGYHARLSNTALGHG